MPMDHEKGRPRRSPSGMAGAGSGTGKPSLGSEAGVAGASDWSRRTARSVERWLETLTSFAYKIRHFLYIALALFFVFCVWGLQFLTLTSNNRVFIGQDNPYFQTFEEFEANFTSTRHALITVEQRDPSKDIFTVEALEAVYRLTEESWQVPHIARVNSLTNFVRSYADEEALVVEGLLESEADLTPEKAAEIRGYALQDRLVVDQLVSRQGEMTGVALFLHRSHPEEAVKDVARELEVLVNQYREDYPELIFAITGSVALSNMVSQVTLDDLTVLAPLSLLATFLALAFFVRSLWLAVVVVVQVFAAALMALGLAGWAGHVLNPASVNSAVIISVLGIAHGVHLITSLQKARAHTASQAEAVSAAFRTNLMPVFLSTLSTVIGCLSMHFSDSPPFAELGYITAVGLTVGFIYWSTLLPLALRLVPLGEKQTRPPFPWLEQRLTDLVLGNSKLILYATPLVVGLVALGLMRLELNDNFLEDIDTRYEFRQQTDRINAVMTGAGAVQIVFDAGEANGATDPGFLAEVDEFDRWLRAQPEVWATYSVTEIIKRLNRDVNNGEDSFYKLPETQDEAGQLILLYELSLPESTDLTDQIDLDRRLLRVTVRVNEAGAIAIRAFESKVLAWAEENLQFAEKLEVTGLSAIYAHISEINIRSMLVGTFLSLIFVSLMLVAILRVPQISAFSLLANILPSVVALGIWGLISGEVGMAVSVVVALTFGIVVDDTIHFLTRYIEGRKKLGLGPEEALRYTFKKVGRAIVVTSVILCMGFLFLIGSGYAVTKSFGVLSASIIGAAVIFDLIMLPAILLAVDKAQIRPRQGLFVDPILGAAVPAYQGSGEELAIPVADSPAPGLPASDSASDKENASDARPVPGLGAEGKGGVSAGSGKSVDPTTPEKDQSAAVPKFLKQARIKVKGTADKSTKGSGPPD